MFFQLLEKLLCEMNMNPSRLIDIFRGGDLQGNI